MREKKKQFIRKKTLPYLLLLPAIIFIIFIIVLPMLRGIQISFYESKMLKPYEFTFCGFKQYAKAFSLSNSDFWNALRHSIIWSALSVTFGYLIGLILALLLNRDIKGRGILRAILLIPWVMPTVVASAQWKLMYASFGLINSILKGLGIISDPILFLGNPNLALFSVCFVNIWRNYPFMTIVLLASLQTIPEELYEVADIDGASTMQKFWYITMPHLLPITMIATILVTIWSFNNFDFVFLVTGGGPAGASEVLPTYVYLEGFRRLNPSYGASIATSMLVLMTIIIIIYMRIYRKVVKI